MISEIMTSAYCDNCNTLFRVERTPFTGSTAPFVYCPICGVKGISASADITPDEYWSALGKEYGFAPDLMREIFNTWNTSEHATLREHVHALLRDAAEKVQ